MRQRYWHGLLSASLSVWLAACGGGGGSSPEGGGGSGAGGEPPVVQEPQPAQPSGWKPPQQIPEGFLNYDDAGLHFVVSVRAEADGLRSIRVRRWMGGTWGDEQVIYRSEQAGHPSMVSHVTDKAGNFYVSWTHMTGATDSAQSRVAQIRRFDAALGQWGPVQQLVSGEPAGGIYFLNAADDGSVHATWSSLPSGSTSAVLATARWTPQASIPAEGRLDISGLNGVPRFNPQGHLLVLRASRASDTYVSWQTYSAATGWSAPVDFSPASHRFAATSYTTPGASGRGFWLIWNEIPFRTNMTYPGRLLFQQYEPGKGWSAIATLAETARGQVVSDVDHHPNGNMIVGWQRINGDRVELMTRVWFATRGWGQPKQLASLPHLPRTFLGNPDKTGPNTGSILRTASKFPQLAIGPNGQAVAMWVRCDQAAPAAPEYSPPAQCYLQASRMDDAFNEGASWSTPERLTEPTADDRLSWFDVSAPKFLSDGSALFVYKEPRGSFSRVLR